MTRKKITPKPVSAPLDPEYEYVEEVVEDEPSKPLVPRGCLYAAIGLVLLFMFVMFVVTAGGVAWWYFAGRGGDDGGKPDGPRTSLFQQIDSAMSGENSDKHALYLSKVCRGVGDRLKADFDNANPVYDQRTELAALAGHAGHFSVIVNDDDGKPISSLYPRLPDVIRGAIADALGGETPEGGPVTPGDETKIVGMWNSLADAFAEVAR